MKFVLLIVGTDSAYQALDEQATKEMYAEHDRFGSMLSEKGVLVGGAELAIDTRIVRRDGDERVVTTGPYGETAEGLGGWYIVEVDDIDTAAELAKSVPILPTDHVEVRQIK